MEDFVPLRKSLFSIRNQSRENVLWDFRWFSFIFFFRSQLIIFSCERESEVNIVVGNASHIHSRRLFNYCTLLFLCSSSSSFSSSSFIHIHRVYFWAYTYYGVCASKGEKWIKAWRFMISARERENLIWNIQTYDASKRNREKEHT